MSRIRQMLLLLFWMLVLIPCTKASHIIGGEISYECLGYNAATNSNTYRFTLKIYRNCNSLSMDDFSDPAPIGIYRGNGPFAYVQTVYAPLTLPVTNIPPDANNPCLELPPNICVEEGIYTFQTTLPVISESYHISYQRCCRNITISNIQTPNRVGATYTVEVTSVSQNFCNSSPEFIKFPPIVICANEPISFDHSAKDKEGDQLVYELCAPLLGGGVSGSFDPGDPTSCDGFRPDPACAPPYSPVKYIQPTYSALKPMLADPALNIDPVSGLLDGVPTILGQYVVGICVKEYRDGKLLSVLRRDFQFNVANCEPFVKAIIAADEIVDGESFVIKLCGQLDAIIINKSVQRSNIDDFYWTFDIDGDVQTINSWDAPLSFPDTGTYYGVLVLNPNSNCGDSAKITIRVLPDLIAGFSYSFDSCVAGPVQFTDQSFSEAGGIVDWRWRFAQEGSSDKQSPAFLFKQPGDQRVTLAVEDVNGCVNQTVETIPWHPAPAVVIVEPSSFEGCEPLEVFFDNLSSPINEDYQITWDFGDGNIGNEISPRHIYQAPGIYSVAVEITSPIGCFATADWDNWINVKPLPKADFIYSPDHPNSFQPEVQFTDRSMDAIFWKWDFDGEDSSYLQHPVHLFRDTGAQAVQLVVTHASGCMDTVIQWLDVEPQIRYFLPNAFSPNGDDVNDFFRGGGVFEGIENFDFSIWNRWGERVFYTKDPGESWNGSKNNVGEHSPNGVYVCLVTFTGPRGKAYNLKGFVTLVR